MFDVNQWWLIIEIQDVFCEFCLTDNIFTFLTGVQHEIRPVGQQKYSIALWQIESTWILQNVEPPFIIFRLKMFTS
jgi:hypothetical protein